MKGLSVHFSRSIFDKVKSITAEAVTTATVVICAVGTLVPTNAYAASNGSTVWVPDGEYTIQSASSGYWLNEGKYNISVNNYKTATSFRLTRDSDGYYTITSVRTGRALDVSGGSAKSGANVQTWSKNGSCAQRWALDYIDGTSFYTLRNACSGNALDIRNGAIRAIGTSVQSYAYNGSAAQIWQVER